MYGDIDLYLNGQKRALKSGDVVTIEPGVKHSFKSAGGAVVEEISSTHFKEDSFYVDESITQNTNRKTLITDWLDYSPNA